MICRVVLSASLPYLQVSFVSNQPSDLQLETVPSLIFLPLSVFSEGLSHSFWFLAHKVGPQAKPQPGAASSALSHSFLPSPPYWGGKPQPPQRYALAAVGVATVEFVDG